MVSQVLHNRDVGPHAPPGAPVDHAHRHEHWRPFLWAALCFCVAGSAIIVKQARVRPQPMVGIATVNIEQPSRILEPTDAPSHAVLGGGDPEAENDGDPNFVGPPAPTVPEPDYEGFVPDARVRWFNARPVRPARVVWMTVTAYSPDARSCGASADGITATLHSVTTNGHRLVASDPTVLPYGSMLSVPGYAMTEAGAAKEPSIVPVLDCGSQIKGYRLDVLFPTHEQARKWGVQLLPITVWAYADGLAPGNVREDR